MYISSAGSSWQEIDIKTSVSDAIRFPCVRIQIETVMFMCLIVQNRILDIFKKRQSAVRESDLQTLSIPSVAFWCLNRDN